MQAPGHIIVIRFSAMGDVAMAVPVVKALLLQHPQLQVTFVSNAFLAPLFAGIDRCHFFAASTKGEHKGVTGLWKLFQTIKKGKRNYVVADLHNVLRSTILTSFFRLSALRVATIDKGREEKKSLTAKEGKKMHQLPTSHERYAAVFSTLGFSINLQDHLPATSTTIPAAIQMQLSTGKKLVGVAPFAQHREKMYPLPKMKLFLEQLVAKEHVALLFFGAPGKEAELLQGWAEEIPSSLNVAGKISFAEELLVIGKLNMMISMDSANMHLASLYAVPVLSIWGATHPFAGFYGWQQDEENIVQADLYCRPCSVFGNKPCYRGDHACMHLISSAMLIDKATMILNKAG